MRDVFIVGSKGIPGAYGGYETFVDKLTEYHQNEPELKYHVACKNTEIQEFEYQNAHCFNVRVPNIGPAQAIYYDLKALRECYQYIKRNDISGFIIYILACRIGPFAAYFQKKAHRLGGKLYVNPDGHEWMRAKWSVPVRMYWKLSERMMINHSDLVICDSKNIEKYIREKYVRYNPKTIYISYGTEARKSKMAADDPKLLSWCAEKGVSAKKYYLIVGRFVPENNFETIIREFMKTSVNKDLVIITDTNDKLQAMLKKKLGFENDARIKFVGTVYEQEMLMKIREDAYGYIHGHEVGGTNPSLIEALGSTDLNLLLNIGFNQEVAEDSALYWGKEEGVLSHLIDEADSMNDSQIEALGGKAKKRVADVYTWDQISGMYEMLFLFQ